MKFCSKCYGKNENENIFCNWCGNKFDEAASIEANNEGTSNKQERYTTSEISACPLCNTLNAVNTNFCLFCGTSLTNNKRERFFANLKPFLPIIIVVFLGVTCLSVIWASYGAINSQNVRKTAVAYANVTPSITPTAKRNIPSITVTKTPTKVKPITNVTTATPKEKKTSSPTVTPEDNNGLSTIQEPNGKIVYSCNDADGFAQICIIDPDGSNERLVINDPQAASTYPILSPDGQYIIYTSNKLGDHTIYEMDLSTRQEKQLTDPGGDKAFPQLSPDGRTIIFTDVGNGQNNIYWMNRVGGSVQLYFPNATHAVWSPNGDQLAFICNTDGLQICVVDSNGNNIRQVTQISDMGSWVSWSPDGSRFVFSVGKSDDKSRKVCEIGIDGENFKVLYEDGDGVQPSYSPDGNWIVFINYKVDNERVKGEIFIMRRDGSDVRQVTHNERSDWLPFWGSD